MHDRGVFKQETAKGSFTEAEGSIWDEVRTSLPEAIGFSPIHLRGGFGGALVKNRNCGSVRFVGAFVKDDGSFCKSGVGRIRLES